MCTMQYYLKRIGVDAALSQSQNNIPLFTDTNIVPYHATSSITNLTVNVFRVVLPRIT